MTGDRYNYKGGFCCWNCQKRGPGGRNKRPNGGKFYYKRLWGKFRRRADKKRINEAL